MARTNYEVTPEMAQRMAFKKALLALEAAGTNAAALFAYVTAKDAFEHRAEMAAKTDEPVTVVDAILDICECELDDPRDDIIDFWQDVSNMATTHYGPDRQPL